MWALFAECALQAQLGPLVLYEDCEDFECCYGSYHHQCTADEDCRFCRPFVDYDLASQRCADAAGCADDPIRLGYAEHIDSTMPVEPCEYDASVPDRMAVNQACQGDEACAALFQELLGVDDLGTTMNAPSGW